MIDTVYTAWTRAGIDAWGLALDASAVIRMRVVKCVSGGDLDGKEARLMVLEKLASARTLQVQTAGKSPLARTRIMLDHYRSKVSGNRKRLACGL